MFRSIEVGRVFVESGQHPGLGGMHCGQRRRWRGPCAAQENQEMHLLVHRCLADQEEPHVNWTKPQGTLLVAATFHCPA